MTEIEKKAELIMIREMLAQREEKGDLASNIQNYMRLTETQRLAKIKAWATDRKITYQNRLTQLEDAKTVTLNEITQLDEITG